MTRRLNWFKSTKRENNTLLYNIAYWRKDNKTKRGHGRHKELARSHGIGAWQVSFGFQYVTFYGAEAHLLWYKSLPFRIQLFIWLTINNLWVVIKQDSLGKFTLCLCRNIANRYWSIALCWRGEWSFIRFHCESKECQPLTSKSVKI